MPDTLLSIFPKPEDLLALQPEDLAGVIREIAPGVMQNGMFNVPSLLAQLFSPAGNGYPSGVHEQVRLAIAEAISWLTNQGLVILDPPTSWYRLTRRGSQLKTRADVEAFSRGGFPRPEGPQNNVIPGAPGADPNLSFATDTPLALRSRSNLGGALAGPTEVFPLMNPPAGDRSPAVSGGAAIEAGTSGTQPAVPVQSYLVTTPLGSNAELISLTLRFDLPCTTSYLTLCRSCSEPISRAGPERCWVPAMRCLIAWREMTSHSEPPSLRPSIIARQCCDSAIRRHFTRST
jgi:hypothetical protein